MVIFDYYAIDYLNQRLADVILFLSLLTLLKLRLSSRRKPAMHFPLLSEAACGQRVAASESKCHAGLWLGTRETFFVLSCCGPHFSP